MLHQSELVPSGFRGPPKAAGKAMAGKAMKDSGFVSRLRSGAQTLVSFCESSL